VARPEPWRLLPDVYPIQLEMQTRFQDMDVNGHLNNVAFAALFENGRVRLHRDARPWEERPGNERTMVANVNINYIGEGRFPDPVIVCSGVGRIGKSSWVIEQAMFQNGVCIATCDSVIACRTDGQAKPLRKEVVAGLEAQRTTPR
jgi:acyl-CoA thioester hydrolase